jgi:transposase
LREALEPLTDRTLIDRCAELCPTELRSPSDSVQHALRALAGRWLALATEIKEHDAALEAITQAVVPTLKEAFGIAADSAAEMMIIVGDNPARLKSEAAFAKLCGACPVPASTGVTNRHRLFRGGHRQANAALYRIVTVRMRWHQPTMDYAARRAAEGLSKKDIIRCLKRFVAREIYRAIIKDHGARQGFPPAA